MIELRDYQQAAVDAVRGAFRAHRSVLLVAPTGSGKTVMFSYIAAGAKRLGNTVLILAHRQELIEQIARALREFNVDYGLITPDTRFSRQHMVHVGSTPTVVRRLDQMQVAPNLIVIDEAHHATAKNSLGRILANFDRSRVLGVTATPIRLSGEGMGEIFQTMVVGPTTSELIKRGALSPVRIFAPPTVDTSQLHLTAGEFRPKEVAALMDKPTITGSAVEHYKRLAHGKRAVAFCTSIEHAKHVAMQFNAAGFKAMHIDGGMDTWTRREAVRLFQTGDINVLTSCDLISEGFDCPGIEVGLSLRPTASTGLWLQQCGRCLRPAPGKAEALILDHAGNALRHGLPTEDREWSLEGISRSTRRSDGDKPVSVRVCLTCFAANRSGSSACRECGTPFPISARSVSQVEGQLEEITATTRRKTPVNPAATLEALRELGKMRGYKNPDAWADHVWRARMRKRNAA